MNLIHLGDLINNYIMDRKKFLKISLENFVLHKNVVSFSFPTLLLTPFSLYLSPYVFSSNHHLSATHQHYRHIKTTLKLNAHHLKTPTPIPITHNHWQAVKFSSNPHLCETTKAKTWFKPTNPPKTTPASIIQSWTHQITPNRPTMP